MTLSRIIYLKSNINPVISYRSFSSNRSRKHFSNSYPLLSLHVYCYCFFKPRNSHALVLPSPLPASLSSSSALLFFSIRIFAERIVEAFWDVARHLKWAKFPPFPLSSLSHWALMSSIAFLSRL